MVGGLSPLPPSLPPPTHPGPPPRLQQCEVRALPRLLRSRLFPPPPPPKKGKGRWDIGSLTRGGQWGRGGADLGLRGRRVTRGGDASQLAFPTPPVPLTPSSQAQRLLPPPPRQKHFRKGVRCPPHPGDPQPLRGGRGDDVVVVGGTKSKSLSLRSASFPSFLPIICCKISLFRSFPLPPPFSSSYLLFLVCKYHLWKRPVTTRNQTPPPSPPQKGFLRILLKDSGGENSPDPAHFVTPSA